MVHTNISPEAFREFCGRLDQKSITTAGRERSYSLSEKTRRFILEWILQAHSAEKLPSEEALAVKLGVSRTTVRTALHSLDQEGIISRRRAIGTTINRHVRPGNLALQRMVGLERLLEDQGYEVKVDLEWSRGALPADILTLFPEFRAADAVTVQKSYFAGGTVVISIRDFMAWENLLDDEFDNEVPVSIYEFSDAHWIQSIDHALAEIVPVVMTAGETTRLPVGVGQPFLRLLQRSFSTEGQLLAVSVVDAAQDAAHFEVFRRR